MPPVNTPARTPPLTTPSGRLRSSQAAHTSLVSGAAASSASLDPLLESESESRRHRRRRSSVSMRRLLEPEFAADLERSMFTRYIDDEDTRRERLATMEAIARHWHAAMHNDSRRDTDISSRHRSSYGGLHGSRVPRRSSQRQNTYDAAAPMRSGTGGGGGGDEDEEDILALVAGALGDESLPRAPSPPLIGAARSSRFDRDRGSGEGRGSIDAGVGGLGTGSNDGTGVGGSGLLGSGSLASTMRNRDHREYRDYRSYWNNEHNPNRYQPWYETEFDRYSARPASSGGAHRSSVSSRPIEEAIKYLTKLQHTPMEDETLQALAVEHFKNDFPVDDFMVNTKFITIPPSSWMAAGGHFKGTQFAANSSVTINRRPSAPTHSFASVHQSITSGSAATTQAPSPSQTDESSSTKKQDDKWTVHVTIHSVDYDTMKLSGTMQAFEVPDWQSATGTSSINTFWEGEIIDFQKHGLETLNFHSSASIDGTYWRKLEPFAGMNDFELAQKLVSKKFLKSLSEKWILMRWKEKCFVSPSAQESGLTISGFYFVCLRRSDGTIEGFYFDPHSTPYQQLSLSPSERHFPAYQFR